MKRKLSSSLFRVTTLIGLIVLIIIGDSYRTMAESITKETVFEAEEAILNGVTVENSEPGYSGTGYVVDFGESDQSVTFTVDIPADSLYDLTVGYGAIYGDGKVANVLVNGEPLGTITMESGFGEANGGKVLLNEGSNTLTITPNWTYFSIDYIKISPSFETPEHEVEKRLINPQATKKTVGLYSYLVDNFGKNILSGQQGDPRNDLEDLKIIEGLTGKQPAILGLDLMDYSPSRVEHGAETDVVERAIDWNKNGGIVTLAWHWNAPKDLLETEEKPWWSGFYTDATTFDIEYTLKHPESEEYELLLRDIDAIAEELQKLQEAGVPVLWRPLHEAEGGWFWWGAKGPEPVKELWKLMYERMTNEHKLDNLIWVWNSIDKDWYPGNDYVDIVSFDSYPGKHNYTPQSSQYEALVEVSGNKKPIAMAENGPIPDPNLSAIYHSNYSYFTSWNGLLTEENSEEHIKKVYSHDRIITRDELPLFENYLDSSSDNDEEPEPEPEPEAPNNEEDVTDPKDEGTDLESGSDNEEESEVTDKKEDVTDPKDEVSDLESSSDNGEEPEANDKGDVTGSKSEVLGLEEITDSEENGSPLPNTATPIYTVLLIGLIMTLFGFCIILIKKRKSLR